MAHQGKQKKLFAASYPKPYLAAPSDDGNQHLSTLLAYLQGCNMTVRKIYSKPRSKCIKMTAMAPNSQGLSGYVKMTKKQLADWSAYSGYSIILAQYSFTLPSTVYLYQVI